MLPHPASRRRTRGEDGVSLILFALAMVAILYVVAIVIDLSSVRNTRQDSKLLSDTAATAGLQSLATDGTAKPWRGVCTALAYLKANESDLTLSLEYRNGYGTVLGGNPCTSLASQECVANDLTSWAWIHAVAGNRTFDIKSGYVLPDANFPEDAGPHSGDVGATAAGGCDQLAVISSKTDDAYFGGIGGVTNYATALRSVGRVAVGADRAGAPAFLMLERSACNTLSEQVGSSEGGIIVDPASATEPGIIHVDSSGSPASGCTGSNSPAGWAVFGSGNGGAKIVASPSSSGAQGIIAIRALQVGVPPFAYGGSTVAGLSPAPTPGRVVSRKPTDQKYNPSSAPTISNIHRDGYIDAIRTVAPPASYPADRAGAWTTTNCNPTNVELAQPKVFVDCPGGFAAQSPTTFSAATDIIFNGPVSIANNMQLYMPAARRIVIGGGSSTAGLSLASGGRLGINSVTAFANTDTGVTQGCAGREGLDGWVQTTQLTIFGGNSGNGALNLGGRAAMCQTFVYLAGPKVTANANYAIQQITNGTGDPSCLVAQPCPRATGNTATNAHFVISGLIQWSAANQLTAQPLAGSVGVEDLALWTETAQVSEAKSGGDLRSRGVFFLPNGRMEMRSPASATPRDAQFIARSLHLLQGTLRMKPTPDNAVQVPILEGVRMVR